MNEYHSVLENYFAVSVLLFCLALLGLLLKRSLLARVFCLELMLSAVHLAYRSFSPRGAEAALPIQLDWFLMGLYALQFLIGIGVIALYYRQFGSLDSEDAQELRQ